MQRNLRCLYVEENSLPKEVIIPNNLKSKQEKVKGYIEYTHLLDDDSVAIICNEEGKLNGMGPNRDIGYDIIYGPFLIVRECSEDGEDRSLSDEQISKYKKVFDKKSIEKTIAKVEAIKMQNSDYYL